MSHRPDGAEQNEIHQLQERVWYLVVVRRLGEQEAAGVSRVSDRITRRDLSAMRARGMRAVKRRRELTHPRVGGIQSFCRPRRSGRH